MKTVKYKEKKKLFLKEKKLEKKHYFLLIGLIIFGIIYHSIIEPQTFGYDKRYLIYIVLLPTILGVIILGFYRRQFLLNIFSTKKGVALWVATTLIYLLQAIVFSYLSFGQITKMSWDYINYQTSNKSTEEIFKCQINRFYNGKRPSIDFKLNENTESINVDSETMNKFKNKKEEDYYIKITARKGIWNYYILKEWCVEKE